MGLFNCSELVNRSMRLKVGERTVFVYPEFKVCIENIDDMTYSIEVTSGDAESANYLCSKIILSRLLDYVFTEEVFGPRS